MLEHRMIVAVAVSAGLLISVVLLAVYVFDIGHSRSNSRQSTPTISRAQNRDDSGVLAAIPGWTDFASSSPNRCVNLEVTFSHDKRFAEVEPVRSTCPDPDTAGIRASFFFVDRGNAGQRCLRARTRHRARWEYRRSLRTATSANRRSRATREQVAGRLGGRLIL